MGARSSGREAALQMLFALEAGGLGGAEGVITWFWRDVAPGLGFAPLARSPATSGGLRMPRSGTDLAGSI